MRLDSQRDSSTRLGEGIPSQEFQASMPHLHMTEIKNSAWCSQYGLSRLAAENRIDEAFEVIDTLGSLIPVTVYVDAGKVRDSFVTAKVVAAGGSRSTFEPDFLCFLGYAYSVLLYVDVYHPEAEKVNFTVEQGNVTKYIKEFHSTLAAGLAALEKPSPSRLAGELISGDKKRIPLQAADLLCWYTARSRRPETMSDADKRRFTKIAHRDGILEGLTEHVPQMKAALYPMLPQSETR